MPVKNRFRIERLPRAFAKDLRESPVMHEFRKKEPSRYYRQCCRATGQPVYCRHEKHVTDCLCDSDGHWSDAVTDDWSFEPVSDSLDRALKLADADQARLWQQLREVVQLVTEGHYNTGVIETLRTICEGRNLYTSEAILASVPPREASGPVVEWVRSAIDRFRESRMQCWMFRQEIIRQAEAGRETEGGPDAGL